jgi:hypothetical protein
MRYACRLAVAAGLAATVFTIFAGAAVAGIGVYTAPGIGAPPPNIGSYVMTPFPNPDPQPLGFGATSVALPIITTGHPLSRPTGSIMFNQPVNNLVNPLFSGHGYAGNIYSTAPSPDITSVTISLPAKSGAFYLYTTPNLFSTQLMTVVGRDATGHTVSTSLNVTTPNGAQYFGFYNTTGGVVSSVTVSTSAAAGGVIFGEFGISNQKLVKIT